MKKPVFNLFFLVAFTVTLYFSFLINLLIIVKILDPGYITLGYFFVAVITIAYMLNALLLKPMKKLLKIEASKKKEKDNSKLRKIFTKLYVVIIFSWFVTVIWASLVS